MSKIIENQSPENLLKSLEIKRLKLKLKDIKYNLRKLRQLDVGKPAIKSLIDDNRNQIEQIQKKLKNVL